MGICKSKPEKKLKSINKKNNINSEWEDISLVKENPNKINKEYKLFSVALGKGAFGEVRKATHLLTGEIRAVKIISKDAEIEEKKKLINEINILEKLNHPNIIKIYEYFQDKNNFYIVTELCSGGELFDQIIESNRFSERRAVQTFIQIIRAINYCHEQNIIHRDLKPENILYDGKDLKLIDFGASLIYKDRSKKINVCVGTPYYIAPEVLNEKYDEKCDVWSCGVILFILLTGIPPFNGSNDDEIFKSIKNGKVNYDIYEMENVSKQAKNLIKKMLTYDPKKRISMSDVLKEDWFNLIEEPEDENELNSNVLNNLIKFNSKNKLSQLFYQFFLKNFACKEELEEIKKVFFKLDKNNDGKLSKEEIQEGLNKIKLNINNDELGNILKKIDLNENETIDYNEFCMATVNKQKLLDSDNLKKCFFLIDEDKNGKISLEEIKLFMGKKKFSIEQNREIEKFFKEWDIDGNNEMDFDEFVNSLQNI